MNSVFLGQPDRYGRFGHQFTSILTSYFLAATTSSLFIPLKFELLARQWNLLFDFTQSKYSLGQFNAFDFDKLLFLDEVFFTSSSSSDFTDFVTLVKLFKQHLIPVNPNFFILPFDLKPGKLFNFLPQVHHDLISTIKLPFLTSIASFLHLKPKSYITFHVRRGDVNPQSHPGWFISDDVVRAVIIQLSKVGLPITVITEQSTLSRDLYSSLSNNPLVSFSFNLYGSYPCPEILDWIIMYHSCFIVGSKSSFSQTSAVMAQHPLYIHLSLDEETGQIPAKFQQFIDLRQDNFLHSLIKVLDSFLIT